LWWGAAFVVIWFVTRAITQVVSGNRIDEDEAKHPDEIFASERQSLHYIRQDVAGILVAAIISAELLGIIAAALFVRLFR
jgi:hypothetical protein